MDLRGRDKRILYGKGRKAILAYLKGASKAIKLDMVQYDLLNPLLPGKENHHSKSRLHETEDDLKTF